MKIITALIPAFLIIQCLYSQPGALDQTFNPTDIGFGYGDGADHWIGSMVEQPDGKILIGGGFTSYNGISRNHIARLNPDGSLDHSFDPGTGFEGGFSQSAVLSIEILPNGSILVGGSFSFYNGTNVSNIVRLFPDGSLDADFDPGDGPQGPVYAICQQPDGKIVIGGFFTHYNNFSAGNVARLNHIGSFDTTFQAPNFNGAVFAIAINPDSSIYVGGYFHSAGGTNSHRLARLLASGAIDDSFIAQFPPDGPYFGGMAPYVRNIIITLDNKLYVTGYLIGYAGENVPPMIRLNPDASLDEGFQLPNVQGSMFPIIYEHIRLSDGKHMISGPFNYIDNVLVNGFARLFSDGTLDQSFIVDSFSGDMFSFIEQENGQIVAAGGFLLYNNILKSRNIARINEDTSLDFSFNSGTGANNHLYDTEVLEDGKMIIAGLFHFYDGVLRKGISRLHGDGSLDTTFDPGTGVNGTSIIYTVGIQSDGKVVAGGNFTSFDDQPSNRLVRLNNNGSTDETFNTGNGASNSVHDLKILDDGKLIIAGAFGVFDEQPTGRIARLNPDGSYDPDFNTGYGANGAIDCLAIQPDGKIIIGGRFTMFDSIPRNRIARLNSNGSLDTGFDTGYGVNSNFVLAAGLQSDGKIIIGGLFTMVDSTLRNGIARLNTDGSIDNTFDTSEMLPSRIDDIVIQADDKIVAGGRFSFNDSIYSGSITRLNADGSIDTSFNTGTGFNGFVNTLSLQADGNIVAGGWFTAYNEVGRNRIARIIGDESVGYRFLDQSKHWIVYPNPSPGHITLKSSNEPGKGFVSIIDLQGRILYEKQYIDKNLINLDISFVPPGVYIVEFYETSRVERIKIIRY